MSINIRKDNKPSYECMIMAENCLSLAVRAKENWERDHHCTTGIVFVAFAVEAMFEFFHKQLDPHYKDSLSRKDLQRMVLNKCGISLNFRGTPDFQNINKCFLIRDGLAHGKFYQSDFVLDEGSGNEMEDTLKILDFKSEQFTNFSVEMLRDFIDAAKRIDYYIIDNGVPLNQRDLEAQLRIPLASAFATTGMSQWFYG